MYEVAILGGGPAGAAAALMLARTGHRVVLADPAAPGGLDFKVGEGLPPAAQPLLRDLGALDLFLDDGHLPSYGNERVWGSDTATVHDFIRDPTATAGTSIASGSMP